MQKFFKENSICSRKILIFSEEQARMLAKTVSVDHTNCSLSFNEFLTLMSTQQEAEPNHETLVDVFA